MLSASFVIGSVILCYMPELFLGRYRSQSITTLLCVEREGLEPSTAALLRAVDRKNGL